MAIKSAQSLLRSQLKNALSLKESATTSAVASLIGMAIAAAASRGLKPATPSPRPLIPSGVNSCISLLSSIFSSLPQESSSAASQIAQAITLVAPSCPPRGLVNLKRNLENSMKLNGNNNIDSTSSDWAKAIISYYQEGGII